MATPLLRKHGNLRQYPRQLPARDGAVHTIVVRRDAPDRGKGGLATGPEEAPFGLVSRHPHRDGPLRPQDPLHAIQLLGDLLGIAVQLAQEDGGRIQGITGVRVVLGRARPVAAGDHRHPMGATQAHDGLDLRDALRNHDRHGQLAIRRQGIALVDAQGLRLGDHGLRGRHGATPRGRGEYRPPR